MSDIAISVRNVSKRYQVFENQRSRLMHAIWPKYRTGIQDIWALQDISFDIAHGEAVAIIGRNGGGKSTLLEILTGTLTPTTGQIEVAGRVSALLELGSGFNPEYTGRDNVILNGLLLGLSREEILRRFDEIVAFAEIGDDALNRTVKTYSSGMVMRLAFAVQVLCDPDILVVDEALSVGDFFFQQKCLSYIRQLCAKGVTLLFVSHDMGTVRDICSRAIYLKKGWKQFDGDSSEAIRLFFNEDQPTTAATQIPKSHCGNSNLPIAELAVVLESALWRSDDLEAPGQMVAVAIYDQDGQPATQFRVGDKLRLVTVYRAHPERQCHVSVAFLNKFDQTATVTGSYLLQSATPSIDAQQQYIAFEMLIDMMLEAGNYALKVNLGYITSANRGVPIHQLPSLGPISLIWDYESDPAPFLGLCGLPAQGSYLQLLSSSEAL